MGKYAPLSSDLENSASHKTFTCPAISLEECSTKELKMFFGTDFSSRFFLIPSSEKRYQRKYAPLFPAFGNLASREQTSHRPDLTPSLSGGRRVRPNLDLDVVGVFSLVFRPGMTPSLGLLPGTKISASGLRDFLLSFFGGATLIPFSLSLDCGVGSANPNAGFRRSTVMTCSLVPTLTRKNFSPSPAPGRGRRTAA